MIGFFLWHFAQHSDYGPVNDSPVLSKCQSLRKNILELYLFIEGL